MKDMPYDSSRPLRRLEKGDKAMIKISRFSLANEKDRKKYKDVPVGYYEAIVISPSQLSCEAYPVLSGSYNYWGGAKRACTEMIFADEYNEEVINNNTTQKEFLPEKLVTISFTVSEIYKMLQVIGRTDEINADGIICSEDLKKYILEQFQCSEVSY